MISLNQIPSSCLMLIIIHLQLCSSAGNCSQCIFNQHLHASNALKKLEPFCGQRFSLEEVGRPYMKYFVGICTTGEILPIHNEVAVFQVNTTNNKRFIIGNLTDVNVMAGSNWLMLQYKGGDNYDKSCGISGRQAYIMITCNLNAPKPLVMKLVEENSNEAEDCYYLFQMEDASMCNASMCDVKAEVSQSSHLSAGSILCIVFFSTVSVYLIGGFLFLRFVRGERGANQIPNIKFWRELGSLVADGCDLVCRCNRGRDSYLDDRGHRGIVESASDHIDVDDRLLGM